MSRAGDDSGRDWTQGIPVAGGRQPTSRAEDAAAAHRRRLYEDGLCRSCEMPLLDEELAEDAQYCGVCRAVRARRKAMKRSPETSPQEVNAYYAPRIAEEQARRRAAGLPEGGRTSRDREHGRRKRARAPKARPGP